MSTNPPFSPQLGPIYGSVLFGTIVSSVFYGVACMQTFFYYVHYQSDPFPAKTLVTVLWALNTVHEALCVAGAYKFIMAGLMNQVSFTTWSPELIFMNPVTTLVAVPTQGFLIYRIYHFGGKKLIFPLIFVVLALVQLACSIIYAVKALSYRPNCEQFFDISGPEGSSLALFSALTFSSAAGVDILIAISTTFLLARRRMGTHFASTAHILQRLIVFAINTGTWTAIFALLTIVLMHLFPSNTLYTLFLIPVCSIYSNTLLVNLNARTYVRDNEMIHDVELDLIGSPSVNHGADRDVDHGKGCLSFIIWKKTVEASMLPSANTSSV